MDEHLRERWLLVWEKNKKRFFLYTLLVLAVAGILTGLSIFRNEMDKKAWAKFNLATTYFQQAQSSEDDKGRLAKYQKAKSLYEEVLSRYPWTKVRKEALFYLGNCLYCLGEYKQAGQILQKFCRRYEDDYFFPWAEIKLAFAYEQQGQYEEAIKTYEELLKKYPDNVLAPQALLGMARCLELQGKWNEALSKYEELVSRYPLSSEAALGEVQIQRLKGEGKVIMSEG